MIIYPVRIIHEKKQLENNSSFVLCDRSLSHHLNMNEPIRNSRENVSTSTLIIKHMILGSSNQAFIKTNGSCYTVCPTGFVGIKSMTTSVPYKMSQTNWLITRLNK